MIDLSHDAGQAVSAWTGSREQAGLHPQLVQTIRRARTSRRLSGTPPEHSGSGQRRW